MSSLALHLKCKWGQLWTTVADDSMSALAACNSINTHVDPEPKAILVSKLCHDILSFCSFHACIEQKKSRFTVPRTAAPPQLSSKNGVSPLCLW